MKLKTFWAAVFTTLLVSVPLSLCAGACMNWPELGVIAAVVVMGGFIIHSIEEKK